MARSLELNRVEIRLYTFAAPDKQRPVLVLTRSAALKHLNTVTVAPITTTIRGVPSEVILTEDEGMEKLCAVNLHNLVTVSSDKLGKRVAALSNVRMDEICRALNFALGC